MMLEIDTVTHSYGDERAVSKVSFGIDSGELVALLGPSGCGKTTLVQAIAGHVTPTEGRVWLRGTDVTAEPPENRRVGVVFQQSTLFPHMTVGENVAYGLKASGIEAKQRTERVREYLELVGLGDQRSAYPNELSGGQRRRVELARALAPRPDLLLLDEPLSALDRTLRTELRAEIDRIQSETGVTTVYVTHNQEEAMALADRLLVMRNGRIAGVGSPRDLYESPPNPFVASFLGRMNTLSVRVVSRNPTTIAVGDVTAKVDGLEHVPEASEATLHVRPEQLSIEQSTAGGAELSIPSEVIEVADVGRRYDVTVEVTSGQRLLVEQQSAPPAPTERVSVTVPLNEVTVFDVDHERVRQQP